MKQWSWARELHGERSVGNAIIHNLHLHVPGSRIRNKTRIYLRSDRAAGKRPYSLCNVDSCVIGLGKSDNGREYRDTIVVRNTIQFTANPDPENGHINARSHWQIVFFCYRFLRRLWRVSKPQYLFPHHWYLSPRTGISMAETCKVRCTCATTCPLLQINSNRLFWGHESPKQKWIDLHLFKNERTDTISCI